MELNNAQKIEWIHSQLSELKEYLRKAILIPSTRVEIVRVETMQSFIEDIREDYMNGESKYEGSNDRTE